MRYRYYYCDFNQSPELIEFLTENGIAYKEHYAGPNRKSLIIFNIWSNKPNSEYFVSTLKKMNRTPHVYIEYSEADRKKAKLLWLHPKKQKIDLINEEESFEFGCWYESWLGHKCYKHETQKGLLSISKEPSTNSKDVFWTISTGFSELFVDRKVFDAVKASSLIGIELWDVLLRDGRKSDKIFQMTSSNIIGRECFKWGYGEVIEKCPVCGKEQYDFGSDDYQLHLDTSKINVQSDFYVTDRMFSAGIARPIFIISQQFYQLLKKSGLTGGAVFIPIVDIAD